MAMTTRSAGSRRPIQPMSRRWASPERSSGLRGFARASVNLIIRSPPGMHDLVVLLELTVGIFHEHRALRPQVARPACAEHGRERIGLRVLAARAKVGEPPVLVAAAGDELLVRLPCHAGLPLRRPSDEAAVPLRIQLA